MQNFVCFSQCLFVLTMYNLFQFNNVSCYRFCFCFLSFNCTLYVIISPVKEIVCMVCYAMFKFNPMQTID